MNCISKMWLGRTEFEPTLLAFSVTFIKQTQKRLWLLMFLIYYVLLVEVKQIG